MAESDFKKGWFSRQWGKLSGWNKAKGKPISQGTSLVPSYGWNDAGMGGYVTASQSWDPSAPPYELPLYGQPPTVLVQQVAQTLIQLEQGSFYQAAYLWDGMLRDDRITATFNHRIDRLIGSPVLLEPPKKGKGKPADQRAQDVADACEEVFYRIVPPHQQYEMMRIALGLSSGIGLITPPDASNDWTPTFKVFNDRFLRYDWLLREYRLVTENRGEITVSHEDPEWMIYEPFGPHGWLHGAMIRSLALPWLIRFWARQWWSREREVHGQPLRLGVLPSDRRPEDEKKFLSQLANIGHEAVIRIPQGLDGNKFDVKLLEAASNSWEGFLKLIEHCDDSIAIVGLGQRQSTMGQGGLKAQDDAGESVMMRMTRKDSLIRNLFREKLLKPWAKANFGDENLAPNIVWQFEPAEDEQKASIADMNIATACQRFDACNAPIDMRQYLSERGYPLLEEAAHAALVAAKQQTAKDLLQPHQPQDGEDPESKEPARA